jgi:hypothetical protein
METTTRSEMPAGAGKSSLNPDALNQLLGQMVSDLGAAVNGALVVLGDGLGIYRALADMMQPARLFFSLQNRSQYSLIQIALPR